MLLTCIKRLLVLKNIFVFLRVAALHRSRSGDLSMNWQFQIGTLLLVSKLIMSYLLYLRQVQDLLFERWA